MNRICKKCGEEKPLEEFINSQSCKYNKTYNCKICAQLKNIEYRKKYAEIYNRLAREKYAENPEIQKKYYKKYYRNNRERLLSDKRVYDLANADKKSARDKKRRDANPEIDLKAAAAREFRKKTGLLIGEIPKELLQYKIVQIKLKRKIKNYGTSEVFI